MTSVESRSEEKKMKMTHHLLAVGELYILYLVPYRIIVAAGNSKMTVYWVSREKVP